MLDAISTDRAPGIARGCGMNIQKETYAFS
jgi:hypothetical protein